MNSAFCRSVIGAIKSCLPDTGEEIALHAPCFVGNEWNYVTECLNTGWVSSVGTFVNRFEEMLAGYTGVKGAVSTVNGTAALHICLKIAEIAPGDEVLVPALTFVATANAVSYCGATPHLADCEEKTLGLDPYRLGEYLAEITEMRNDTCFNRLTGNPIRAVVPVHTFGHPVDLDPLVELCARFKLTLIEDAAESLGSFYKGRHTGHWGKLAALSFNGNKTITTGGGGAILTNDESLAKLAKHLTTTARVGHNFSFFHDQIGYNYRMPNLNAALGCAQLEQLPGFIEKKRALAEGYRRAFQDLPGVRFFVEPAFARSNYWLNVLLLDEANALSKEELLDATNKIGIHTRPAWTLIHRLPMYQDCPRMDLKTAENLEARLINIPSSPFFYRPQ
ncbi:MAG TPA: LegC family aminotransferase [Bacillota bacterium]|nr:LegC family aminotransferase [Bacillota bacterium]